MDLVGICIEVSTLISERMRELNIHNNELGKRVSPLIGLNEGSSAGYVGYLLKSGLILNSLTESRGKGPNYLGRKEHLRRISIVLFNLEVNENSQVITHLKNKYPAHFIYPPNRD